MRKIVVLLGLFWGSLTGCSIGSPSGEEIAVLVDELYATHQAGDIEAVLPYYDGGRSTDQWRAYLKHVQKNLGKVKSYQLKNSEVNTVLSGRYYIFDYQVVYDSGKQAKETITFFDTVEVDDKTLVAAHNILAVGFNPLF